MIHLRTQYGRPALPPAYDEPMNSLDDDSFAKPFSVA